MENKVTHCILFLSIAILIALFTVLSLNGVSEKRSDGTDQDDAANETAGPGRRRGALSRRRVAARSHTKNKQLAAWAKVATPVLIIQFVVAITGVFFAFDAFWNVYQIKHQHTDISMTCFSHGWRFSGIDPETGSPRYSGGQIIDYNGFFNVGLSPGWFTDREEEERFRSEDERCNGGAHIISECLDRSTGDPATNFRVFMTTWLIGVVCGCAILLGYANLASDLSKPAHNVEGSDASNTRHAHKGAGVAEFGM
jgi:hypothetical protein